MVKVGTTMHEGGQRRNGGQPGPEPSALNTATPCRHDAASSESPTMPLVVIITAANTVSLASDAEPARPRPSR